MSVGVFLLLHSNRYILMVADCDCEQHQSTELLILVVIFDIC